MTAVLASTAEANTPAWDAARATGIGGSEIAAIVGLSPYVSKYALWQRKAGRIPEQRENAGMSWGKRLEDVVAGVWAETHPQFSVHRAGVFHHATRDWQRASPDRLLFPAPEHRGPHGLMSLGVPAGILEVKTAHANDYWQWGRELDGPIPPYYRCQAIWYGDVFGLDVVHFAVLIGGSDYREYEISWDPGEADWLREEGEAFWQSLQNNSPPDIDESDHTYQAIRQLHPDIEEGLEVPVDIERFVAWQQADLDMKDAKARIGANRNPVADQLGRAQYGTILGERVVRRQSKAGGVPYPMIIPPKKSKQQTVVSEASDEVV